MTGITRGILDQENGMNEENTARFLEQFPEINANWLLTGEGEMLKTELPVVSRKIPLYDAEAAAGYEYEMNMEPAAQTGTIDVGDMLRDSEAALRIYGNSMIPGYPPGSIIGLKQNHEGFIEPGNVYVVETANNRYVKRLYYNEDKTAFVCHSDNHVKHQEGPRTGTFYYSDFEIPLSDVRKVFIVTGVIKRNAAGTILHR